MAEIYNFFGDIFDYLRETYLEVDFGSYENITVTSQGVTLGQMVIALAIGCLLAAAVAVYHRGYLGRVVRGLLAAGAHDEAGAKTLAELGLERSFVIRRALSRRDNPLRKLLRYVGEEEPGEGVRLRLKEELDFSTTRFYIPEALRLRASVRYDSRGTDGRALLFTLIALIVASVLLIRFLPAVLGLADDFVGILNGL